MQEQMRVLMETTGTKGKKKPKEKKKKEKAELGQVAPGSVQGASSTNSIVPGGKPTKGAKKTGKAVGGTDATPGGPTKKQKTGSRSNKKKNNVVTQGPNAALGGTFPTLY
jgi:hypothetical protein